MIDAVMDFPVSHRKNTVVSLHLEQEMRGDKIVKMVDLRYWYVSHLDGKKHKGKGIRFELEPHALQLGQRLLSLYKRHRPKG